MSTKTTNLELTKPEQTENYNVDVFNANYDLIDGAIEDVRSSKSDNLVAGDNIELTVNEEEKTITISVSGLLNFAHPIGSIYTSVLNTSPATLFGGTWQQIKDRFLLAAGDTYTAGNTAGEATHILTEAELPKITPKGSITNEAHSHGYKKNHMGWWGSDVSGDDGTAIGNSDTQSTTDATTVVSTFSGTEFGGGQAHNNMPPYLVVFVWKRTA